MGLKPKIAVFPTFQALKLDQRRNFEARDFIFFTKWKVYLSSKVSICKDEQ